MRAGGLRLARTPGEGPNQATGYGLVDPLAALTRQLVPADQKVETGAGAPISVPRQPDSGGARARKIVFGVTAASVALMAAAVGLAAARRRGQ